jgi:hypothetical protein
VPPDHRLIDRICRGLGSPCFLTNKATPLATADSPATKPLATSLASVWFDVYRRFSYVKLPPGAAQLLSKETTEPLEKVAAASPAATNCVAPAVLLIYKTSKGGLYSRYSSAVHASETT